MYRPSLMGTCRNLVGLAVLLSFSASAFSAEVFWQSGGSNNWQFKKNWKDGAIPTSEDIAIFNERSETWAGPNGAQDLTAGAIIARGTRTTTTYIQPFKNSKAVSTLTLHGVTQQVGGVESRLLIGNYSDKPLAIVNRDSLSALNVKLGTSGVIDAQGPITIGSPIIGSASITKRGPGELGLGDPNTVLEGNLGEPGNTFTGDFILEEGVVSSYASSRHNRGEFVASPFGLGTLQWKGGTIKSQSGNPRTYFNSVVIDGNVTIGSGGPVRFSKRTGGKTTIKSDSVITVDSMGLIFEQPVSGDVRVTKEGKGLLLIEGDMTVKELIVKTGGVRVTGSLTCEKLVVEENGSLSGTGKFNCKEIINPDKEKHSEFTFKHLGKEIYVLVYRPEHYKGDGAIIFFHGASRDSHGYRKSAAHLADKLGMLLVVPDFDRTRFSGEAFQEGGVMKEGKVLPPEEWTFTYVDPLLKTLENIEGKKVPYYYVGHSGGAQFVDRMAAFAPPAPAPERIVAVNPGSLVFPTRDQVFPYGYGNLPEEFSNDEVIKRYLATPLTLFLGTADITRDALPVSDDAMKQGATRIERGRNCYAMAKQLAESKGWPFNWRIVEAEGQGHGSLGMWKNVNAVDAVLGKPNVQKQD